VMVWAPLALVIFSMVSYKSVEISC
jgi:hypothetical protein